MSVRGWDASYLPFCPHPDDPHKPIGIRGCVICRHTPYYGRCLTCQLTPDDIMRILAVAEGIPEMPSLSSIMQGADATWGEQLDKTLLAGVAFYIHNCRESTYSNDDNEQVDILVLDITLGGASIRDPHGVIVVGNSPERAPILAYFNDPSGSRDAIGPCHTYEVALKNKRTFWRIEDFDAEIMAARSATAPALSGGK